MTFPFAASMRRAACSANKPQLLQKLLGAGRFRLLLVLLCLLAAAAVGSAQEAAGGDGAAGDASPAVDAAGAVPSGDTYSLEQALADARESSYALARARVSVDRADAGLSAAQAEFRPRIGFSGSMSYLGNPPEGIAIEAGSFGSTVQPGSTFPIGLPDQRVELVPDAENTFFRLQTTLSQPVFTWGRLETGLRVAEAEREIAQEELRGSARQVRRDVTQRYFAVRFARQATAILAEAEDVLRQITDDRRRAFNAGAATRQAVLEAEANQAGLTLQRVQTQEGLRSAQAALALLTGLESPGVDEIALSTPFRTLVPTEPFADLLARAQTSSPDLRSIRARADQARGGLDAARASGPWRPSLGLEVGFEVSGQRVPFVAANWRDTWDTSLTVSLGFNGTAFDFGRNDAEVAEAEAQLRTAEIGAQEALEGLEVRLRSLYEGARTRDAARASAQASFLLAEERFRNAEVSFENDLITRSELLQAQVGELVSRIELLTAEYELESALSELELVVGDIPSIARR